MTDNAPVEYRIAVADAHAHLFEVRCTVADPAPGGQRFRLPTWVPGSYLIREFARHFVEVRAEAAGGHVAIVKEAKDTWRAAACTGPLTVVARVYAFDVSVRTAYLDATRGYFNGGAVFLSPEGRAERACTLRIELPDREPYRRWRIATTLAQQAGDAQAFRASDYDDLIDHPVEMGGFIDGAFTVGGVRHRIAVSGRADVDMPRLTRDLAQVCKAHVDLFGGPPPFADGYLFQVMAVGEGYGGLEHRSSTSLVASRKGLPAPGMEAATDDYVSFLGLASHEYFHAWNVKRIKPAAFVPYDLARESYTRQLWVFEGITSYYDDLALVRSRVIDEAKYLELLGRNLTRVLRTPCRHMKSVADASFDAWSKHYRPDDNSPNATISYYAKGAVVALALDLLLRGEGKATLDDVMRALWQRHGARDIGVPEDGLEKIASELAGRDLREFFARCVDGTDDPPLAGLLAHVGIALALRPAASAADRGGKPAPEGTSRSWIGAKIGADLRIEHAFAGGPAERAGLAGGDVLVAFDGVRASLDALNTLLERRAPGARVGVHAFRRDELMTFDVDLAPAPLDTAVLTVNAAAGGAALLRRAAWLGLARGAAADATDATDASPTTA